MCGRIFVGWGLRPDQVGNEFRSLLWMRPGRVGVVPEMIYRFNQAAALRFFRTGTAGPFRSKSVVYSLVRSLGGSNMPSTRREFLRRSSAALTVLTLSPTLPSSAHYGAAALEKPEPCRDTVLVVLQLSGGNDGLNTVVPYTDDADGRGLPYVATQRPTSCTSSTRSWVSIRQCSRRGSSIRKGR